jgi:hypothetical protein
MRNRFRTAAAAIALIAATCLPAQARKGGDVGLGFIVGDPTGISGKIWLSDINALDFIAGFGTFHNDYIELRADYVWHEFSLFPVKSGQLPLYYGMGLGTAIGNRASLLSVRGVVGIEYLFAAAPLDVFLELGPGAAIIPNSRVDFTAGLGMRFFF